MSLNYVLFQTGEYAKAVINRQRPDVTVSLTIEFDDYKFNVK